MHPLHHHAFVFDGHCDTLAWTLPGPLQRDLRQWGQASALDLPRLRAGGVNCQVFACFPGEARITVGATSAALQRLEGLYTLIDLAPDQITLIRTRADLDALHPGGPIGAILGLEGSEALEGTISLLRTFHRLGLRLLGLAWNPRNAACDGVLAGGAYGLTDFGREVVTTANRLGIVIDVSHLNAAGVEEVLEISQHPVIASHSNARALFDHPRNLTDAQIQAIAGQGGVVGATFVAEFMTANLHEATFDHFLAHLEHILDLAGPEHVGLGSDYDGATICRGLESGERYPLVTEALLARGYPETTIRAILGENLRRVFRQVLPAA
ncbi:MAG: dipeptidase [Caldilineales bacterium]|nr:dipeptidase [Caldilineales bacterium]MCW5859085.1 dipeptidase [Caldilineales bacterium]